MITGAAETIGQTEQTARTEILGIAIPSETTNTEIKEEISQMSEDLTLADHPSTVVTTDIDVRRNN